MVDIKTLDQDQISFVLTWLRKKYAPSESTSFLEGLNLQALQTLLTLVMTKDKEKRSDILSDYMLGMKEDVAAIKQLAHKISQFKTTVKEGKENVQNQEDLINLERELEQY